MTNVYGLDGLPIVAVDFLDEALQAGRLLNDIAARRVALNEFVVDGELVSVSTVFLPWDASSWDSRDEPEHVPVLYETLVSGGPYNGLMKRYSSRDEAAASHERIVDKVRHSQDADRA